MMQVVRAQVVLRRWALRVLRRRRQAEQARKFQEYYKSASC